MAGARAAKYWLAGQSLLGELQLAGDCRCIHVVAVQCTEPGNVYTALNFTSTCTILTSLVL